MQVALRPRDASVIVEVQDYRADVDALCPVSSAFLSCDLISQPSDHAVKSNLGFPRTCRLWRNVLRPFRKTHSGHHSNSMLGLDAAMGTMVQPFDVSIAISQDQLETLALDAMPLFLESEVMSPRMIDVEPLPAPVFLTPIPTPPARRLEQALPATWSQVPIPSRRKSRTKDSSQPNESNDELSDTGSGYGSSTSEIQSMSSLRINVPRDDYPDDFDTGPDSVPRYQDNQRSIRQPEATPTHSTATHMTKQSPLPATLRFIEKLKGKKRRRIEVPSELSYNSPTWRNRGRVDHFFRAASLFERQHAVSLQVCR